MTRVLLSLIVSALVLAPWAARAGDLTLRDVIELYRSGLGEELLIAVIDADGGPFALGFADIQDLKSEGLSERVITALVRTGARPHGRGAEVPAVSVEQHVTNVVPGLIVVGTPNAFHDDRPDWRHRRDRHDRAGWHDGRRSHDNDVPPATWITRREDGRNVAQEARRQRRDDKPAATWVTPNSRTEPRRGDDKPPPRR